MVLYCLADLRQEDLFHKAPAQELEKIPFPRPLITVPKTTTYLVFPGSYPAGIGVKNSVSSERCPRRERLFSGLIESTADQDDPNSVPLSNAEDGPIPLLSTSRGAQNDPSTRREPGDKPVSAS